MKPLNIFFPNYTRIGMGYLCEHMKINLMGLISYFLLGYLH